MLKFSHHLYSNMQSQLQEIQIAEHDEYQRMERSFHIVETTLMKLKQFIATYTFQDRSEEIHFFKTVKPSFHRELIYLIELIHIETNKPRGSAKESVISYYQQIAERIRLYFEKQNILYLYYHTGRSSEDDLLFLRDNDCIPLVREDSVDLDPQFSTVGSGNFARIMGFEMVLDYIDGKIQELERPLLAEHPEAAAQLTWTDSKADLIELVYALHAKGSINHGNCDIKDLITLFETMFHIKVGNFYRHFQSMRIRKKTRTIYLDATKVCLEKRMDDTDLSF